MKSLNVLFVLTAFSLSSFIPSDNHSVKDYFNLPGPIEYRQTKYYLSWSAHPSKDYYKQEYLSASEKPETFHQMMLIEVLQGEVPLEEIVRAKIEELDKRKAADPTVHYTVSASQGKNEYLLDFVIGQSSGSTSITEWNVYRYARLTLRSGKAGILLFACSKRGYDQEVPGFLKKLKSERVKDLAEFSTTKLPAISLSQ